MFEVDNTMEYIRPHLLNNGFEEIKNDVENTPLFITENCSVEVDLNSNTYLINYSDKQRRRYLVQSDNLNIYWLFGFLAANDLIDRNFKL